MCSFFFFFFFRLSLCTLPWHHINFRQNKKKRYVSEVVVGQVARFYGPQKLTKKKTTLYRSTHSPQRQRRSERTRIPELPASTFLLFACRKGQPVDLDFDF